MPGVSIPAPRQHAALSMVLLGKHAAHLPLMGCQDHQLAPRAVVPRSDLPGVSALCDTFFTIPSDTLTMSNLFAGALSLS